MDTGRQANGSSFTFGCACDVGKYALSLYLTDPTATVGDIQQQADGCMTQDYMHADHGVPDAILRDVTEDDPLPF